MSSPTKEGNCSDHQESRDLFDEVVATRNGTLKPHFTVKNAVHPLGHGVAVEIDHLSSNAIQPSTSMTVAESAATTSEGGIHSALNLVHTSKGSISKLNLKVFSRNKCISTNGSHTFRIAQMCKNKYLKQIRKRLVWNTLNRQNNQFVSELMECHIQNSQRDVQNRRYSNLVKLLCLAVQGCDAQAYQMISEIFTLPSSKALIRFRQTFPCTTGISKAVLHSIFLRIPYMTAKEKLCVLMFRRISVSKHLTYDSVADNIVGFEDVGGSRSPIFADSSLVFMVRGLMSKWKQPIAFHLGQAIREEIIENVIRETVVALQGVGLRVVAIVSDNEPSNIGALRTLAMNTISEGDVSICEIGCDKISIFIDPLQLLEELRKTFLMYDVEFKKLDGSVKMAKFDVFRDFLEHEKKKQDFSDVYPHLLSDLHLDPNSQDKVNERYAKQFFSFFMRSEVRDFALPSYQMDDPLNNMDAYDLSEFIDIVYRIFDTFNINAGGSKSWPAIKESSHHHAFWQTMKENLNDWKFVKRSPCTMQPQSQCFYLLQRNITAVQSLWNMVRKLGEVRLETRNLNQDSLAEFVGRVRARCGSNTNPSSQLVLNHFRIVTSNCFSVKMSSKCDVLEDNIRILTGLLKSEFERRENHNFQDTTAFSSKTSQCIPSKELETCTTWIQKLTCNKGTDGVLFSAVNFLSKFLRKDCNYHLISSCFHCFHSVYLCKHHEIATSKMSCDKNAILNSSLALEMFKIYVFLMQQMQNCCYVLQVVEKLEDSAAHLPLQNLSCSEHREKFHATILTYIVRIAIQNFCFNVNGCVSVPTKSVKSGK